MKSIRRVRLSDYVSEPRVLCGMPSAPLVKALLGLAELVVRDGCVKSPLEFYKELANQPSPWIPLLKEEDESAPRVKIRQVCSTSVRKLAVAIGLSREGFKAERDDVTHIVILMAAPAATVPAYLALVAHGVRLLEERSRRERLLDCANAAEVCARIEEFEGESESAERGDPAPCS